MLRSMRLWAAAVGMLASAAQAQLIERQELAAGFQIELARAVQAACASTGHDVAVAIADPQGVVRTLLSGEKVSTLAVDAAQRKARTAARVGMATGALGRAAQAAPAYGDFLRSTDAQIALIGGGLPLHVRGRLVGAVGVGGAPGPDADERCGQAAVALLAERVR